jgi:hypothetical protein
VILLLLGACGHPTLKLGRTVKGADVGISVTPASLSLFVGKKAFTPYASVGFGADIIKGLNRLNTHITYVELVDKTRSQRHVFKLEDFADTLEVETKFRTKTRVVNELYSTLVTIDADEISTFIRNEATPHRKPHFPHSPWKYFVIWRSIDLDWSVNGFFDVIADIIYVPFLAAVAVLDVALVLVTFAVRVVIYGGLLAWYLLTAPFA